MFQQTGLVDDSKCILASLQCLVVLTLGWINKGSFPQNLIHSFRLPFPPFKYFSFVSETGMLCWVARATIATFLPFAVIPLSLSFTTSSDFVNCQVLVSPSATLSSRFSCHSVGLIQNGLTSCRRLFLFLLDHTTIHFWAVVWYLVKMPHHRSPPTITQFLFCLVFGVWGGGWSGGSIGGSAVRRRVIGGIKDDAAHWENHTWEVLGVG